DFPREQGGVLFANADGTPLAESRERLCRPPTEENDDPLAQPVEPLHGLGLEAHAEGEEHHDRHRAPGDAEDGEGRAEPLLFEVCEEIRQHYLISFTGFSTTRSPSFSPFSTSMLMASESPVLILRTSLWPLVRRTV